jgi:hypothetical protein
MALDYASTAALMTNQAFRDRVKIACLKYADYVTNEGPGVTAHWTRLRWAQMCVGSPENAVQQIMPLLIMDGQVQLDGDAIIDNALQTSVETVINKLM